MGKFQHPNNLKFCQKCRLTKHVSFFNKNARNVDGLRGACKQCEKGDNARRYLRRKEKKDKG